MEVDYELLLLVGVFDTLLRGARGSDKLPRKPGEFFCSYIVCVHEISLFVVALFDHLTISSPLS